MPENAVLVTTAHRGVFYGVLVEDSAPKSLTLTGARNCIYWSKDVGGFLGLAAIGPTKDCRIGAKVSQITLYDITSVTQMTEAAADRWEAHATWK